MKFKIVFTIGIGFDANNNPINNSMELGTKTFKLLAQTYGGFTAIDTLGGWIDDNGNFIEERGLQIQCLHEIETHIDQVRIQANHLGFVLASLWNQQCVVVEVTFGTHEFISQSLDQKI